MYNYDQLCFIFRIASSVEMLLCFVSVEFFWTEISVHKSIYKHHCHIVIIKVGWLIEINVIQCPLQEPIVNHMID